MKRWGHWLGLLAGSWLPLHVSATNESFSCQEITSPPEPLTVSDWQDQGYTIGDIVIDIQPIFNEQDPAENTALGRWANRLHRPTQAQVVRQQLLFQAGDRFAADTLAESERLIRANDFFHDAKIFPVAVCDGQVTVKVQARDLWTLIPDLDYQNKGGDSSHRIGFRDSNFWGLGKQLVAVHKADADRSGLSLTYTDPNLLGSRYRLRLQHDNNDDGDLSALRMSRPFYALSTPWSASLWATKHDREADLFFRNEEIQTFLQQQDLLSLSLGRAVGTSPSHSQRWFIGYTLDRHEFATTPTTTNEPFPDNREYAYPWLAWQWLEHDFIEAVNINQLNRTEDLNLGWDVFLRLGRAADGVGSTDEGWVYDAYARRFFKWGDGRLFSLAATVAGIDSQAGLLNHQTTVEARYYHSLSNRHQWVAAVELTHRQRPFIDQQTLLGGDSGLRGYPSRYQSGDRRFLLTLEHRIHFNRELWRLFDTGAVVFADVGRAWFDDRDNGINGGVLKDIGIGLRLSPTRAGKDVVLHLDLAVPLDQDDPKLDDWQFNFEAKRRF